MAEPSLRPRVPPGSPTRPVPAVLAGVSGCLFLLVWTSWVPPQHVDGLTFLEVSDWSGSYGWGHLAVLVVTVAVGLSALRWWPFLLVVAGLLDIAEVLTVFAGGSSPLLVGVVGVIATAGYPLTLVGVLAGAQSLVRTAVGWAAVVTGLCVGALLLGAIVGRTDWLMSTSAVPTWHVALVGLGLLGILPAAWLLRHGDQRAIGLPGPAGWSWPRIRPVLAGTLAVGVVIPLSLLTIDQLQGFLDVSPDALYQYERERAVSVMIGVIAVVAAATAAAVAGPWSVAGALTAAVARAAALTPMFLALSASWYAVGPDRLTAALVGVVLGAVAAGSRWRVPLASALAVLAAMALFVAYVGTRGIPLSLAENTTPLLLILVLITAAATAVTGASAPALAVRGTLPAAVGPIAAVLAGAGLQMMEVTSLRDGTSEETNRVMHLTDSAVLLLVAGVAVGGLGFAHLLAARRAERKQAEQIQREAAAAERDRLARSIHDGVLQVLALVQRDGSQLGGHGAQLAALAAEQEVALRTLLSKGGTIGHPTAGRRPDGGEDLRPPVRSLGSTEIEVVTPAEPVLLPAPVVAELTAAVQAALDNVGRHAGPAARAWVLLEDEQEAVRVTVRDNGVGFPSQRLAEAAEAGRLGVAQSIRGRITDLGGTTTIHSHPGEGTEVELWVPRRRPTSKSDRQ